MKLEKFRLFHSEMIEYYQRSEICIRELYNTACEYDECKQEVDADWGDIFDVIDQLKLMQDTSKILTFPDMLLSNAEYALQKRDYWLFECYLDIVFDKTTHSTSDLDAIKRIAEDYSEISTIYSMLYTARDKARKKIAAKQKRAATIASKKK